MKKIFTLSLLFLLFAVGGASAQSKKTWAFKEKGLSDVTIANLNEDGNWTAESSGTGWYDTSKSVLSGELEANGEVIKELEGITIGTTGLSNSNNLIIRTDRVRINRDKMTFNLPQLKNGQTITIVCQSANGSATDRGVKASYDYMQRIEGPEDNLILGTAGEVTNKWQVVTDSSEPVDIQFTMITGGIDFRLIMIDEGDEPQTANIAYLYDGNDNDQVLAYLSSNELYTINAIDVTKETVAAETLRESDITVIGAGVPADNAAVEIIKEALPWTPVLNFNADLYAAWGYGEPVVTSFMSIIKNLKNTIFSGLTEEVDYFVEDGVTGFPISYGEPITGVILGDYFAGDDVPAVSMEDNQIAVIHLHNINHNGYIYIPNAEAYAEGAIKVIDNAVTRLIDSKTEISAANAPAISIEYKNLATNVTITAPALPKARVFYTTDGTEPTAESTEYTGVFTLTEESTVKAVAIAEGYTLSAVAEKLVDIREQPKTPVIKWTEAEDGVTTTIKITGEGYDENVKLYYNFATELTTDTLKSTLYVDSIPVVITMPQTVTAFAVAGGAVWSEVAQARALVRNPRVVIDVAAHYSAPQWTADNNPDGLAVTNGKGMFTWGASAATMYIGEGTPGYDEETGDETIIYTDEDLRPYEVVNEPGENPEWMLKSRGTCLIWQNNGPDNTDFGSDENGYHPMYSTDVDPLFPVSKNDIQFYKFYTGETPNASIETIKKYQAPLDVVVLANMAGGPLVAQVSEDGEKWETVGEIAKTGKARMWSKYTLSYDGTNEVYVRITEEVASTGPKVFDIYIANQGEKSQELLQELKEEYATGIQTVEKTSKVATAGIYNLNGMRQNGLQRGLNIVVGNDGTVKKVLVK